VPVIDEDNCAGFDLVELFIVDKDVFFCYGFACYDDLLVGFNGDGFIYGACADFRTFRVEHDCDVGVYVADRVDDCFVRLVRSVREVESGNVHAGLVEFSERRVFAACGSDRCDYFCMFFHLQMRASNVMRTLSLIPRYFNLNGVMSSKKSD